MSNCLLCLGSAVPLGVLFLSAQPAKEEAFGRPTLQLQLHVIDVDYGDQNVHGAGALLRGEPFELDVAVVNGNNGPRAKVESDWFNRMLLTIRPGRMFEEAAAPAVAVSCVEPPEVIQEADVEDRGDHLLLGRDGYRYVRCRANPDQLKLLRGVYTLRVEWGPGANVGAYPDRFHQNPPFKLEFEFRDVSTDVERLDFDLHMAYRAWRHRQRGDEALEYINNVLVREPFSTAALVMRAEIQAAKGACREAAADWQKAAQAMRTGMDVSDKRTAALAFDDRQQIATRWQGKADSSCR